MNLIAVLLATVFSTAAFSASPGIEKTATYLAIKENKYIDLTSEEFKQSQQLIAQELTLIFETLLTEEGKEAFTLEGPVALGKVYFAATEDFKTKLSSLFPEGTKEINLEGISVGNDQFDAINKKYNATKLVLNSSSTFILLFNETNNPYSVARELKALPVLQWAEPSYLSAIGANTEISRTTLFNDTVSTYIFWIGDGDCPSGCTEKSRTYLEVQPYAQQIKKVGRTGSLPDETYYKFFKQDN
ncbi:MAG: hypothetical protein AB7T49_17100 [Oligoflexales bacterium]